MPWCSRSTLNVTLHQPFALPGTSRLPTSMPPFIWRYLFSCHTSLWTPICICKAINSSYRRLAGFACFKTYSQSPHTSHVPHFSHPGHNAGGIHGLSMAGWWQADLEMLTGLTEIAPDSRAIHVPAYRKVFIVLFISASFGFVFVSRGLLSAAQGITELPSPSACLGGHIMFSKQRRGPHLLGQIEGPADSCFEIRRMGCIQTPNGMDDSPLHLL